MKQKYFFLLLIFNYLISFGQNNALEISSGSRFNINHAGVGHFDLNVNSFTIEYDFYLNELTASNARLSSLDYFSNSLVAKPISFFINNSGASILTLGDGVSEETIPNTPSFNAGQWYHIAIVVVNNGTKNVKLYVNGVQSVDYNFSNALSIENSPLLNLGGVSFVSSANVGNAKYDNVRVWSVARNASEIINNYNTCLNNNETGLVTNFTFDGFNYRAIKNTAISYPRFGEIVGAYAFSQGTGCTVASPFAPITVTGDYAGIYYYVDTVNGKPHYKTDNLGCEVFLSESPCDYYGSGNYFKEIVWDNVNNNWVLRYIQCVWLFTNCANLEDPISATLATNTANTSFVPCTGWVFSDSNANSTFSSPDCPPLSTNDFDSNSSFNLYPNPVNKEVEIQLNNLNEAKLEVLDVNGRVLKLQVLNLSENKVDVSQLPAGIYLFKISSAQGVATKKVVKQ